jgi:hypothetical protein
MSVVAFAENDILNGDKKLKIARSKKYRVVMCYRVLYKVLEENDLFVTLTAGDDDLLVGIRNDCSNLHFIPPFVSVNILTQKSKIVNILLPTGEKLPTSGIKSVEVRRIKLVLRGKNNKKRGKYENENYSYTNYNLPFYNRRKS